MTAARILIGAVLLINLQAAVVFVLNPTAYTPGFEVSGVPGNKLVQGMGILFLMWTVPYFFAFFQPVRNKVSLITAVMMQAIGVMSESLLLLTLPEGHLPLVNTAQRFIAFDAAGLAALLIALWITLKLPSPKSQVGHAEEDHRDYSGSRPE